MANKRKFTTAIVAGVTAVALLLGGTFAWTSISQQAKNEAIVDINPGGRLHDDFNGTNKDVYVENFGNTTTGVPIYARVRLDQYFEVGQEAGENKTTAMADRNVEPLIGEDINDVKTWVPYIPGANDLADTAKVPANGNWQWKLGNDNTNMPIYLPTFNMNKDSLAADINGTYEGNTDGDIVHYDDYKTYTDGQAVPGTEIYDWDSDTQDEPDDKPYDNGGATEDKNTPIDSADVYHKSTNEDGTAVSHTPKPISSTATVITMAQWIANGKPVGPYWVYDTDGWAYWAQAIEPGETTGLLLDGISMSKVPDDNYYYGINVVGEFATKGDLYEFTDMSPEAEELFAIVSGSEAIVISGPDTITLGTPETYTATRTIFGEEADTQPTIVWTATDAAEQPITGVTMNANTGELSVDDTVALGTQITVTATASNGTTTLAEGDGATPKTLKSSKVVTVLGSIIVTADGNVGRYNTGTPLSIELTADIVGAGAETAGKLTWSVTDRDGTPLEYTTLKQNTTDGTKATLDITANETASIIVAKATYKLTDSGLEFEGTHNILSEIEIATTDEMTNTKAVAVLTENGQDEEGKGTYTLTFVRVENDFNFTGYTERVDTYGNTSCIYEETSEGTGQPYKYNGDDILRAYYGFESQGSIDMRDNSYWLETISEGYITEIIFANTIQPTNTRNWFYNYDYNQDGVLNKLKTVDASKLDTSKVESMEMMFDNCNELEKINGIEKWDVRNVKDMKYLFYECSALTELDVSAWKTDSLTDMTAAFAHCKNLKQLDLSGWSVGKVTDMSTAFAGCTELKTPGDLSGWDVSAVTDMLSLFRDCDNLLSVGNISAWNTTNVTSMLSMFKNCYAFADVLDLSGWDVNNVNANYSGFMDGVPEGTITAPIWKK